MKCKLKLILHVYKTRELASRHVVNKKLSIQKEPFLRTNQFQTNSESLLPFLTVQNAHSHVFYFNSNINKDKPHLMSDAKPFISCFLVNAHSIINRMDELERFLCT